MKFSTAHPFRRELAGIVFGAAVTALMAFALATSSSSAHSAELEPAHYTVRFADLDLKSAAAAAVLYSRIRSAAHEVCGQGIGRGPQSVQLIGKCVSESMARAIADVNSRPLSEYHAWRGK